MANFSLLVAVATKTKFRLSGQVAAKLKELDATYCLASNRLAELNGSDLRTLALEGQRRALQQLKAARTADDVAAVAEPSKSALASAASEQRQSLKHSLRAISAETVELVRPETQRFLEGAQKHLDGLLADESALSLSYGMPHAPSPLLVELQNAIGRQIDLHAKPHLGSIFKPSSLVEAFATL
jgi:hypothetical protein